MDLSQWIAQHASRTPARTALRFEGRDISYAELAAQIDGIAAALAARHVRPGDRVAWLGLNSPAMLATLFACARVGAIFLPLNWRLAAPEHKAMLQASTPALLFVEDAFAADTAAQQVAPRAHRMRRARRGRAQRLDALGRVPRRRPRRPCRPRWPTPGSRRAAVLHLRLDGTAQGRAAEPGGAGLQRRQQRRHARPGQHATGC